MHGDTNRSEMGWARYAPFGGTRLTETALGCDRLFTGQTRDYVDTQAATNNDAFYFFKSRYYDATIGKFYVPDTVVPDSKDPQALNRYAYALNNPLRLVDPSGHDPMDPKWIAQFERQNHRQPTGRIGRITCTRRRTRGPARADRGRRRTGSLTACFGRSSRQRIG